MKRYLLFIYDKYEPYGGWHDKKGDFNSIEEAETGLLEYLKGPYMSDYNGYSDIIDTQPEAKSNAFVKEYNIKSQWSATGDNKITIIEILDEE